MSYNAAPDPLVVAPVPAHRSILNMPGVSHCQEHFSLLIDRTDVWYGRIYLKMAGNTMKTWLNIP